MKKYLISIEDVDSPRLYNFFGQTTFKGEIENFKKFGVIGKQLNVEEYFKLAVAGQLKALTPGELGCTLSHLAALRDFLQSEDEYAIVFEDDVIECFPIDLAQLNDLVTSLALKPCFFLSLGGIQFKICDRVRGRYIDTTLIGEKILEVDSDFLENLAYAYAYIVDRKMAELLLDYHQTPKIYDHWQELTNYTQPFSFYACYLFDHPIIANAKHLSYLESERLACGAYAQKKSSYFRYWRRKLKKIFLNKFNGARVPL